MFASRGRELNFAVTNLIVNALVVLMYFSQKPSKCWEELGVAGFHTL